MTYPVIGAPPSFDGFVHFKSAWSLSQSTTSTSFGLPGSSIVQEINQKYDKRINFQLVYLSCLPHGSFAKTVLVRGVGSEAPIFDTAFTRNLYSFLVVKSVTS